ncbi:MAG: CheF family chemotaxis protein [Halorientalis sp.]
MARDERQIGDFRGKFSRPVSNARERQDAAWTRGRIVLSNRRLVFAHGDDDLQIPLAGIEGVGGRFDVTQAIASEGEYLALELPDDVVLVHADDDHEAFEMAFFRAALDHRSFFVNHPAKEGGLIQDADWVRCRLQIGADAIEIATTDGRFVGIDLDDVGTYASSTATVREESYDVLEVEHSRGDISVETHVAGSDHHVGVLEALISDRNEDTTTDLELSETEEQVVTALYSGVAPFDVPDFLDLDVDEVEAIYERLLDHDVVDEIRVRREVSLNARGRSIASDVTETQ